MPSSPTRKTSAFDVKLKAVGPETGTDAGQFKAVVSAFGNIDSVGDIVMPGAFSKSLARWEQKGDPIPVVWSHDWNDPFSHIGTVLQATETDAGLEVDAQLDLDNAKALQIYRLLKGRRIASFSFAYDVLAAAEGKRDGKRVQELTELDVLEVGPTLLGANRNTQLLDVKSDPPPPHLTPDQLKAWAGTAPQITPATLIAWATERSPR